LITQDAFAGQPTAPRGRARQLRSGRLELTYMPVASWHWQVILRNANTGGDAAIRFAGEQCAADSGFIRGGMGRNNCVIAAVAFITGHRLLNVWAKPGSQQLLDRSRAIRTRLAAGAKLAAPAPYPVTGPAGAGPGADGTPGTVGQVAPMTGMIGRKRHEVMNVSAEEYPVPPPVVGVGALFVEHRLKTPQVSESAYIAPTAVLAGDVTVGPHSRVLFGAVITAEGGPVEIGSNCVVMENAVIRGVPDQETRVGDDAIVGPHAHLTGCVIEGGSRIATGAVVFNGARIETGAEVEFNAVVYVNTVVPSGVAVPMGWFAGGQPAELVAPGDWDRIRAIMGPLDYPGTVFGVASDTGAPMSDVARRYARGLALHHRDHILPDQRQTLFY
jgi:carbonic anhydrase/acetyltransferase-like protein (isoleucine patch superfamily)